MKTLNSDGKGPSVNKGGSLRNDAYKDFADYCAAYCNAFEKETGVELYALGLQNEPEFSEPYNSCVYSPEQTREALRAVGRVFKREGIHTKIYLPEALPQQKHIGDFFEAVNDDPETREYYDIFAIHNYDADGMNVGGATAMQWEKYYNLTSTVDPPKELWMTETSGHPNTWKGAMLLAANIYNALYYGNINAWLWWAIADKKSSEVYALIIDGQPTARYYTSKHYYKYIRPGAVRIKSESGNPDLLSLAFKNSGEYKYVSVLINKGDYPVEVDLSKTDIHPVPEIYLSTENNFWSRTAPGNGNNLSLPPMSIATLTWK
jgi:O-glycosyl hydrolase